MKTKIRVFPDYCSSGLWDDFGMVDDSELTHILGTSNLLALRYLHEMWEFMIACCSEGEEPRVSSEYIERWESDWRKLVEQFNACQDRFEFVSEI